MQRKRKNSGRSRKKVQTVWDLSVFYTSEKDPKIEKDLRTIERAIDTFVQKYKKDERYTKDAEALKRALDAYEKLHTMPEGERAILYFFYRKELNAKDAVADKKLNQISDRLTKASNKLLFFELTLGRIPKTRQKQFLKNATLKPYHYYLERLFIAAAHQLTEPEEKIMNLKSLPAYSLWVSGTEKILNQRQVRFKNKDMPLQEAIVTSSRLKKNDRRALWKLVTKELTDLGPLAENEVTAVVLNKKINDELRQYEKPYSVTVQGYENTEESIEALVEAVTKKGFALSRRFYKLKSELLGEKLQYVDRNASYGTQEHIPFTDATETLRGVFYNLSDAYGGILDRMLEHGQIDVFPRQGKTGGAFCSGEINQPTMVLLNQIDDLRSLMTFAHEMGHAIHTERSKAQRPLYQSYSTATAETASTLFENLVFEALLEKLPEKKKIAALASKLDDDVASIQRQIAFFNFEKDLHKIIREQGGMTHEEMAVLMQKHLNSYTGPAIDVQKEDGYSFVYVSHFRRFFYVYTYAYGSLISSVIASRWKESPEYTQEIDSFLSAGGSMSPEDIFRKIGIDTTKPDFFAEGLSRLEANIKALEKLTRSH